MIIYMNVMMFFTETSQDCETALRVTRVNKGYQVLTSKCQLGQRSFQGQQGQSKDSKVTQGQARLVQGKKGQ